MIAAGRNDPDPFFVGGIDATDEALAAVKEGGAYQATVDQQPKEMGALTVRTLVAAIKGEPYDAVSAIQLAPVNASNVDQFLGDTGEATTVEEETGGEEAMAEMAPGSAVQSASMSTTTCGGSSARYWRPSARA